MSLYTSLCIITYESCPGLCPTEANKNLSPEPRCRMFSTPGSAISFSKIMKFLLLALTVFLVLFQMFPGKQNQGRREKELAQRTVRGRLNTFSSIEIGFLGMVEIGLNLSECFPPRTNLRPHIGNVYLARIPETIKQGRVSYKTSLSYSAVTSASQIAHGALRQCTNDPTEGLSDFSCLSNLYQIMSPEAFLGH